MHTECLMYCGLIAKELWMVARVLLSGYYGVLSGC